MGVGRGGEGWLEGGVEMLLVSCGKGNVRCMLYAWDPGTDGF